MKKILTNPPNPGCRLQPVPLSSVGSVRRELPSPTAEEAGSSKHQLPVCQAPPLPAPLTVPPGKAGLKHRKLCSPSASGVAFPTCPCALLFRSLVSSCFNLPCLDMLRVRSWLPLQKWFCYAQKEAFLDFSHKSSFLFLLLSQCTSIFLCQLCAQFYTGTAWRDSAELGVKEALDGAVNLSGQGIVPQANLIWPPMESL